MIILDTNVLSALMQSNPPKAVVAWLDRQPASAVWTTTITVFEIRYGLALLPAGKRRRAIESAFETAIAEDFENRILAFDTKASHLAATIAAANRKSGRPVEVRDVMIAGIAVAHGAVVATRNTKHFAKMCAVADPLE